MNQDYIKARFKKNIPWNNEFKVPDTDVINNKNVILASILIPIIIRGNNISILLTRRTLKLQNHPGQISFPGGREEPNDNNSIETALRETNEEIGLKKKNIEVLGLLPKYLTTTSFLIRPVVAFVFSPFNLILNKFEVEEIFEIPLNFFLSDGIFKKDITMTSEGKSNIFYIIEYEKYFIWGATAAILKNFFNYLKANNS